MIVGGQQQGLLNTVCDSPQAIGSNEQKESIAMALTPESIIPSLETAMISSTLLEDKVEGPTRHRWIQTDVFERCNKHRDQ